jgi:hypothetical protein
MFFFTGLEAFDVFEGFETFVLTTDTVLAAEVAFEVAFEVIFEEDD